MGGCRDAARDICGQTTPVCLRLASCIYHNQPRSISWLCCARYLGHLPRQGTKAACNTEPPPPVHGIVESMPSISPAACRRANARMCLDVVPRALFAAIAIHCLVDVVLHISSGPLGRRNRPLMPFFILLISFQRFVVIFSTPSSLARNGTALFADGVPIEDPIGHVLILRSHLIWLLHIFLSSLD